MNLINDFFLSKYQNNNFTISKKAKALLYYNFLMITILILFITVYAVINPSGFIKGAIGAGTIIILIFLSSLFIKRGSLNVAVMVYLIPTVVVVIAARFIKAVATPHTGFSDYLYYYFYIIVFTAVFGRKILVPVISALFVVSNIVFYILFLDNLDPVSLEIARTAITNSTPALIVTGVVSYINIRLSTFSNQAHKKEAEDSKKHANLLSGIMISIRQISSNLQNSAEIFETTSGDLSGSAQDQASMIEEASASMEEIAAAIDRVAAEASDQASSISSIETSIDELNAHINNVSERSGEIREESVKAISQGDDAVSISSQTLDSMKSISSSAEKINAIIKIITEIADQTNLLALNASIESARAGEAGKGFAVVADEISKLADTSTVSTKEIIQLINETTENINAGSNMIQILDSHIKNIMSTLEKSNLLSNEMNEATTRQHQLSSQVKTTIHHINELSGNISLAMNETATNATELSRSHDAVNELTQKTAEAGGNILATTEHVVKNIHLLLDIVNEPE